MARLLAVQVERQRHIEEAARQRAEMTTEQRERQDAETARHDAEIAREARTADLEESRRFSSENR